MLISEFEELIGFRVSPQVYHEVIEPMYMSVHMTKKAFCSMFNKSNLKQIAGICVGGIVSYNVSLDNDICHVRYGVLKNRKFVDGKYIYTLAHVSDELRERCYSFGRKFPSELDLFNVNIDTRKSIVVWE